MSVLKLPSELLQGIIDDAVRDTELHRVLRFRETCRDFDVFVQDSIFRLPRVNLVQRRLGVAMIQRLIHAKMLLGNAEELLLCNVINLTADYLAGRDQSDLRSRYVTILETSAANTMMYWKLFDCLTAGMQNNCPVGQTKDNALVAAVGANEIGLVKSLLKDDAKAASCTPFFGEPLATAASHGSLDMVCLLLDHWDWETNEHLTGLRLMNAIKAAGCAGHEKVLAHLLTYRDRIAQSTYDDAIICMVQNNHVSFVDRLLATRREDLTSATRKNFWLRLLRTIAEFDQQELLQRILITRKLDIEEDLLTTAMTDACWENHDHIVRIMMPHISVSDPTRFADSLFWAAWHGNLKLLDLILTFLQNHRRALLLALAGAVSNRASEIITYLIKRAGVYTDSGDSPTSFTEAARLLLPEAFDHTATDCIPLHVRRTLVEDLCIACSAGNIVDTIRIHRTIRACFPHYQVPGIGGASSRAAKADYPDILLFLCENGNTWLFGSCAQASSAITQIFLDLGFDMQPKNDFPEDSLIRSFIEDRHLIRWLLDKGESLDTRPMFDITPMRIAINRAPMSTVRYLLNRGSGVQHGRLLHFALTRQGQDSVEALELLLNAGGPIDDICLKDDANSWLFPVDGEPRAHEIGTALWRAAREGKADIASYLLSRGADANIKSNRGRTALDIAIARSKLECVRLLS